MNCLFFNGKKYLLVEESESAEPERACTPTLFELSSVPEGELCRMDGKEYIVLKHTAEGTELLMKDLLGSEDEIFGENNNYNGSNIDNVCNSFAEYLESILGTDNIIDHDVDLTSDDGLKDYGAITRRVSVLTAERARQYVNLLDKHKIDKWWWLATPWSTPTHEDNECVLCVSPRGNIRDGNVNYYDGVRPFCILKSNILVSK